MRILPAGWSWAAFFFLSLHFPSASAAPYRTEVPTSGAVVEAAPLNRIAGSVADIQHAAVYQEDEEAAQTVTFFFDSVPGQRVGPGVALPGWRKPDASDIRPDADVAGFKLSLNKLLSTPDPRGHDPELDLLPSAGNKVDQYSGRRDEHAPGGVQMDPGLLHPHELGLFERVKGEDGGYRLLRILLNRELRDLTDILPLSWLALTYAHETAHALEHFLGRLNDKEHWKAEVYAFTQQARLLDRLDPTGQVLSWMLYYQNPANNPRASERAFKYLSSLTEVQKAWLLDGRVAGGPHMTSLVRDRYTNDGSEFHRDPPSAG